MEVFDMRLLRATINGFGNWVDQTIDFENESFICLYGENEAGKSTMHQFILFMLFGLTPKWRTYYRPKTSSRMGGRLLVSDESIGEFTIERFDEVRSGSALCYSHDGNEYAEDWLRERLQGMTYQTYQSILSFSSMDLYGIETMSETDLGEVLLGIGLTGSKNILSIEKELDNRMGTLFKPNGTKPEVNQQLNKLDELFQVLTAYKNDESAYREKKMYIQSLEEKLGDLQEKYRHGKEACTLLEKQQQALPLIGDYKYCTEQLDGYPHVLSFPENGLERLYQLNEKALPLKSELSVLQDNDKAYNKKKLALKERLYEDTIYEQAGTLKLSEQTYLTNKRDIEMLVDAIESEQSHLQNELEHLQIDLTIDDLQQMTFPFHLEKTWNTLKQENNQLHHERKQLEEEHFSLNEKNKRTATEQKELKSTLMDETEIIKLADKVDAYNQQEYVNLQSGNDNKNELKWEQMTKSKKRQSNIVITISVILSILLAATGMMMETMPASIYIISLFILLAGISQWIWQRKSIQTLSSLFKIDDEIKHTVDIVTKEEKDDAARILRDDDRKQQDLDTLSDQKRTLEVQLMQLEEKEKSLEAKEASQKKQVTEQYEIYPFLKGIDIAYWTELFQNLKYLKQFVQKQDKRKEELAVLYERQEMIAGKLSAFLDSQGFGHNKKDIESQFKLIDELIETYQVSMSSVKQYDEWMEQNKQKQQAVYQQLKTYEREMEALFKHAHVHSAEAFYKVGADLEKRNKLIAEKKQLEHQILTILTQSEFQVMIDDSSSVFDLQQRMSEREQQMDGLTEKIEEIREKYARENINLENMETSEDFSETSHRFQMEREQLQKWSYEWSVLKTAKEMLVDTKRIYRDTYLHKIIEQTSIYFSTLTDGRYKRIFSPTENTLFQVESEDLVRYNVRELSKGTIDQLYISLRIAISEVLSQNLLLPFIIDDAFVHFDSIRTERMMQIFAQLAKKQQIIIFTSNKGIFQSQHSLLEIDLGDAVRIKS